MFGNLTARARLTLGVLAAVLLLAVGVSVGYLIPNLRSPGDSSVDAGFARDMSTHHAQAVEMAMVAYRISDDSDIRSLGYDIAIGQQWQIGQMQTWLAEWNLQTNAGTAAMAWMPDGQNALLPDGRMPGMASADDLKKLTSSTGKDFNVFWCQLMLRHHLGGIHMAEYAAKHAGTAEVREAAAKSAAAQQYDNDALKDKLTELGAQPIS